MINYNFSIDETGDFNILSLNNTSFTCGVLTKIKESELKELYQKVFKNSNLKRIHFSEMKDAYRAKCKEVFPPVAEEIFISSNKPIFASNQQHWWYAALQAVIFGLFENRKFQHGDSIEISFDGRKADCLGLMETDDAIWRAYHKKICETLKASLAKYERKGLKITIRCKNDNESIFVNFADIICGLVRTEGLKALECDCDKDYLPLDNLSPSLKFQKILQEVLSNKFGNVKLLEDIFESLRNSKAEYESLWLEAKKFLDINFETRGTNPKIMQQLNELKSVFYVEFINYAKQKLPENTQLKILMSMLLFETHNGAIETRFNRQDFSSLLNNAVEGEYCRATENWESYVRFNILLAQIDFNGYNFCEGLDNLRNLLDIQNEIQNLKIPFKIIKDDTTAEITGTIGQSYSFDGNFEKAKEYFSVAAKYVNRAYYKTASYQFCIYWREENIDECKKLFEKQTGKTPEDFSKDINEKNDAWFLLSYARLRGLDIYKNKETDLPKFEFKLKGGYPNPLILKWLAFGEEPSVAKKMLQEAARCLQKENGFAIRTLALPVIHMLYMFEPKNELCMEYGQFLESLKKECQNFASYVAEKSPNLNKLDNGLNLWQKATLLPSYYA